MSLAWETDSVALLFDGGSLLIETGKALRLTNGEINPTALAFLLESLGLKLVAEAEKLSDVI